MLTIHFNQNSGKVYYRYKINTISKVKHPGIFLGVDQFGNGLFLHNHYHVGTASIVTEHQFGQGYPLYLYGEKCSNSPLKVIELGLTQVLKEERYHFANYNCQTFTNTACHNQRKSEDVEKWTGRIFVGSLLLLGIGLAFKN